MFEFEKIVYSSDSYLVKSIDENPLVLSGFESTRMVFSRLK